MSRDLHDSDLNDPANRPGEDCPDTDRPRRRARTAAVVGLSAAVLMGALAPVFAAPAPARAESFADCVNEAVARITAEATALPADQRSAYISAQVAVARARCGAILSSAATTTSTTTTSPTTSTSTSTSTATSTTSTSPTTSTSTTSPRTYEVTVTGVIGTGPQTLVASCAAGDQIVRSRYKVGNPTGSNTSRSVNVQTSGGTVRLTYEVTGTVADPTTSLTVVCRRG